jgi:hypothetical protein
MRTHPMSHIVVDALAIPVQHFAKSLSPARFQAKHPGAAHFLCSNQRAESTSVLVALVEVKRPWFHSKVIDKRVAIVESD